MKERRKQEISFAVRISKLEGWNAFPGYIPQRGNFVKLHDRSRWTPLSDLQRQNSTERAPIFWDLLRNDDLVKTTPTRAEPDLIPTHTAFAGIRQSAENWLDAMPIKLVSMWFSHEHRSPQLKIDKINQSLIVWCFFQTRSFVKTDVNRDSPFGSVASSHLRKLISRLNSILLEDWYLLALLRLHAWAWGPVATGQLNCFPVLCTTHLLLLLIIKKQTVVLFNHLAYTRLAWTNIFNQSVKVITTDNSCSSSHSRFHYLMLAIIS